VKAVKEIMSTDLTYCTAADTIQEAASKMKDKNVGIIPVCGSNREIIGMVTDRDMVIRGYARDMTGSSKINEVMSDKLVSCTPETTVQEASSIMAEHQIRRLPVVERGELVGILALGDLALENQSNEAAGQALEEISERPELH
jgi:CBS domain-containing protein